MSALHICQDCQGPPAVVSALRGQQVRGALQELLVRLANQDEPDQLEDLDQWERKGNL